MRALLSGYYGYGNLGDEALLAGLATGLRRRGIDVEVLSADPRGTRALHDLPAAQRYRGLVAAVLRADVVVSGGGGLLQDATSRRSLDYYLGVLALARALGRRRLVYGQSIGPLTDRGARRVSRALRSVPTAARDRASVEALARLGVRAEQVADAALLLEPPAAPQAHAASPVLLVPRGGYDDLNAALREAARRLTGAGVPLAALALHERQDAEAVQRLASEVPGLAAWHARSPDEALARVARSRYVVSVRLHGLVLAAVAGIGFAGLVYDPKVAGFLEEARAPAFFAAGDPLAPLAGRALDPDAIAAEAMRAAPPDPVALARLRASAAGGLDWLARHIRG